MNREELIEKAAKALVDDAWQGNVESLSFGDLTHISEAVIAVFEEAHTPTDAYGPGGKHENCYFMEHSCTAANVSEPGKTDIPTDDERKVIAQVILPLFDELAAAVYGDGPYSEAESALEAADLLITAGFHHTGPAKDLATSPERVKNGADSSHVTPTDDELRREVERVQKAAWAEIHGQDCRRQYSVAEVKRLVYSFDNLLGSLLHRPVQGEPRHFAPYGSYNALCDESVPRTVAWDAGEYADQRFTVRRDRTTCGECRFRMGLGPNVQAEKPGGHGGTIPLYGMLDVWTALYGTSHPEFDEFYTEHGYAESWARILGAVRERRTVQAEPSDVQVEAALAGWRNEWNSDDMEAMRAALIAAAAVQGGETR